MVSDDYDHDDDLEESSDIEDYVNPDECSEEEELKGLDEDDPLEDFNFDDELVVAESDEQEQDDSSQDQKES